MLLYLKLWLDHNEKLKGLKLAHVGGGGNHVQHDTNSSLHADSLLDDWI